MQIPKLTYRVHTLITAPAIDTDILWGLSILFVGLALLYFVSVFFFRNKISSKSSLTKQRKMELSPMISEFLFYEEDADKDEKSHYIGLKIEIRDLLKDDFNREVLSAILLDLRKDLSGDTQKRLFKLYQDFGLEKDAFQKLKSWRWEVVSKGILELTQMQVEDAYGFIVKFINNRRVTIRKQAEIATVSLKPGGINYFLDTTKYKISEWQQLKLLDVLRTREDFEPPRFKAWLTSTNKHVVLFALRLIQYYHQNDANASLIELVKHKDGQVRKQAIEAIKEFHVVASLPILKGVFWKCTVDIKIAILGAIAELGGPGDIEFLESVSQSDGNFSVKSKAVGAINTIAPGSIMPTEGLEYVTAYQAPEDEMELDISMDEPVHTQNMAEEIGPMQLTDIEEVEKTSDTNDSANFKKAREGPDDLLDEYPAATETQSEPTTYHNPNNNPTEKNKPMANTKKSDKALRKIEIEVEEIKPIPSEEKQNSNTPDFEISEIRFLPIVVADETESVPGERTTIGDIDVSNDASMEIEVHSITDSPEPMDEESEALVTEIKELAFLPFVTDEETTVEAVAAKNPDEEELESLKDIEGYSLSDFEVSFTEKKVDLVSDEHENVDFDLEDESIIDVKNLQVEDVISWLMTDNHLREIECHYEAIPCSSDDEMAKEFIPQPVYYDEHETYMMGLLDDLEELGDDREIPLLEELRVEEGKSFIKDRIAGMIDKFGRERNSRKTKKSTTENEATELPVFSVFADLFKSIDTESKLILLNEVVAVGDEKEIEFLDGLLEDSNPKIRDKAQTVLKLLIVKLSHENPSATYSKGVSTIVAEQIKDDENLSQNIMDGLLSEMELAPAENREIFDVDFELCEVLDKNYDQTILNLPVVATELSPNQDGGSFFKELRNFTKLFSDRL